MGALLTGSRAGCRGQKERETTLPVARISCPLPLGERVCRQRDLCQLCQQGLLNEGGITRCSSMLPHSIDLWQLFQHAPRPASAPTHPHNSLNMAASAQEG